MDVTKKSTGTLIDELITVSSKCWHAQDDIMDMTLSAERRLAAAVTAQTANAQRTKLIRAIDERLDGGSAQLAKTYAK